MTGSASKTSKISREHHIDVSPQGLITVAGGKWTTYRRMAQDALTFAEKQGMLDKRPCRTDALALHGASTAPNADAALKEYGTDVPAIERLTAADPALSERLDTALPYTFAQALYGVRAEMARTVEDVLSRRTRSLLLDEAAALRAAPRVAALLRAELGQDAGWEKGQVEAFSRLVKTDYRA